MKIIKVVKKTDALKATADGVYRRFTGEIDYADSTGEVENADFELKNGQIIWKNGTWKGGYWNKGVWKNGVWKDGLWEDGTWIRGTWKKGLIGANKAKSNISPPEFEEENWKKDMAFKDAMYF